MKRNPRKLGWTKAYRKTRGKEIVKDTALEFEKKRNVPEKYDRELIATTIKAMDRVVEIKKKREESFFNARMKAKRITETNAALKDLASIEVLDLPAAIKQGEKIELPKIKAKTKTSTKKVRIQESAPMET